MRRLPKGNPLIQLGNEKRDVTTAPGRPKKINHWNAPPAPRIQAQRPGIDQRSCRPPTAGERPQEGRPKLRPQPKSAKLVRKGAARPDASEKKPTPARGWREAGPSCVRRTAEQRTTGGDETGQSGQKKLTRDDQLEQRSRKAMRRRRVEHGG